MKQVFILSLSLFWSSYLLGQDVNRVIAKQIIEGDSVFVISHLVTSEYAIKREGLPGEEQIYIPPPAFLKERVINDSIIKEKKLLLKSDRLELSKILGLSVNKRIATISLCFEPRHSIIIYKKGLMSYIDICFSCRGLDASEDIMISTANFTEKKWILLQQFFKAKGFKYGWADEED